MKERATGVALLSRAVGVFLGAVCMASTLDQATVRHVAHLARLRITDAEAALLAEQLSSILTYIEQLNRLDTTHVPPTAHPLAVSNVFRGDAVRPPWDPGRALCNAPQSQDGFFRVPKVLDQES